MITEDPADVRAMLKAESKRPGLRNIHFWPWKPGWRNASDLLSSDWDDFEGTEALARDIVKETRH